MVGKIGNDGITQALRPLNILKLIETNLHVYKNFTVKTF